MAKALKQTAAQTFEILQKLKKQYAVNPTELLATTIENTERRANALMDDEMAAKLKNFTEKNQGAEWWTLMEKLYPITRNEDFNVFVVTSIARDWTETKDWEFKYKYEALEKVKQLVLWKHLDRKRGFGDVEADMEKVTDKLNATVAA